MKVRTGGARQRNDAGKHNHPCSVRHERSAIRIECRHNRITLPSPPKATKMSSRTSAIAYGVAADSPRNLRISGRSKRYWAWHWRAKKIFGAWKSAMARPSPSRRRCEGSGSIASGIQRSSCLHSRRLRTPRLSQPRRCAMIVKLDGYAPIRSMPRI